MAFLLYYFAYNIKHLIGICSVMCIQVNITAHKLILPFITILDSRIANSINIVV